MFGLGVNAKGKSRGLCLLWQQHVNLQLQSYSPFHIDVTVHNSSGDDWRFTGFYGHPETAKRKETWGSASKLSRLSLRLWLVVGDFNKILHQKEKSAMNRGPQSQLNDLRRCLESCNLVDLGSEGPRFTWCNHREDPHTVRARLDRAIASDEWAVLFSGATVQTIPSSHSDHSAILVEIVRDQHFDCKKKRFWFWAMWLRSDECVEVVQSHWVAHSRGSAISALQQKNSALSCGFVTVGSK
ncbi:UNVERIFIED_CONTAM: hypothetical protein Slati_0490100 [Sesamum latifolium]|uniref:Reverse transcriptase n=1 Tax=Sesamum latifolium TaxID=2727402 RepID=A0AAW2XWX3_9LAMI